MVKPLYKKKIGTKSTEGAEEKDQQTVVEPPLEQSEEDSILDAVQELPAEAVDAVLPSRKVALAELPLDVIIPSRAQAREEESLTPESLQGLVESMKEHGIISRIRVRLVEANGDDDEERFELVFGERRWRAARLAGYTHYPVEIAQYTDDELEEVGLIENIQRQDLTPIEEAKKYQRLLALVGEDDQPKYSVRKLAARVGKDKSYIVMRLAVLRDEDLQELVRLQPDVPLRSVYEVSRVENPEKREAIITDIREGRLPKVDQVKERVREATGRVQAPPTPVVLSPAPVVEPEHHEEPPVASVVTEEEPRSVEEVVQRPAVTAASSMESVNASMDSTQALFLFELQLQKDNRVFQEIVHRLNTDTAALTSAQHEVLLHYVDRWGKALMDLKSHARPRE